MRLARCVIGLFVLCLLPFSLLAQQLEIHYIDVGWGGSVLVKGPDGTTVLMPLVAAERPIRRGGGFPRRRTVVKSGGFSPARAPDRS